MPKKTKAIPVDHAEWTFGDALYWHFFVYGTRPDRDPSAPTGRVWDPKLASHACGVSIRGFWNWIDDRHFPWDTIKIEEALFGDYPTHDVARKELRRLLNETRQRQAQPGQAASGNLPAVITGQAVTVFTTPFEAAEVDGPLTEAELRSFALPPSENFGKTLLNPFRRLGFRRPIPAVRPQPSRPSALRRATRKGFVALVLFGIVAGVYGVKRIVDGFSSATGSPSVASNQTAAPPPAQPPGPTVTESREAERLAAEAKQREERIVALEKQVSVAAERERARKQAELQATEAKRRDEERIAALERERQAAAERGRLRKEAEAKAAEEQRREEERLARQREAKAAAEAKAREDERLAAIEREAKASAARERATKEAAARELNIKLKATAQNEADDLCKRVLEGMETPGFTLSCDRILGGGTTLGSTQLRYTVASINECAAKCWPVGRCVGFTFNAADPPGRHACEIFGPTPEGRQSSGWIAGTRQ